MDLDEYLWRNKCTIREFSIKIGCTQATIIKVKHHRGSPKLLMALKIQEETKGQTTLLELLSPKDKKLLEKWMEGKKRNQV